MTMSALQNRLLLSALIALSFVRVSLAQTSAPLRNARAIDRDFVKTLMLDDTEAMQKLLDKGANVNATFEDDPEGGFPLLYAIGYQRNNAVKFLLAHGADVNARDKKGITPLYMAGCTSLSLTKIVVERGADVNALDKNGETALFQTIMHSQPRAVYLIEHGANVTVKNNKQETPLHIAILSSPEEDLVVDQNPKGYVKENGMIVIDHPEGKEFISPKDLATRQARTALVKLLLQKGADVNAKDQDGVTPLDLAGDVPNEGDEVVRVLIAAGARAGLSKNHTVSPLIATLPPAPSAIILTTRLRRAAETDDLNAVKVLLERGANVNGQDVDGSSPLAAALRIGYGPTATTPINSAVVKILVDKGANVNEADEQGLALLMRASSDRKAVELLLALGANVNARDNGGQTALHDAQQPEIIRMLLDKGADINARDSDGRTPLMTAAAYNNAGAVQVLLTRHADAKIKDKNGKTALSFVNPLERSGQNVIRLLKQAGATK